jgi:hypothetical protein
MKKGFWIVVAVLAASIAMNVWFWTSEPEIETILKRDTVWRDTVIHDPAPAETINTGRVVYIRVPVKSSGGLTGLIGDSPRCATAVSQAGTVPMARPMAQNAGTVPMAREDSIDVPIPIVQKRYEDSLYTAWVSGFEPKLDSIRLYTPEIQTTVTKTVYEPTPLLTLGVQVGGGYGLIHRQPDIYVGIGGQINLWPRRKRH